MLDFEEVSLSERFGIHLTFSKPNKETFLHIVNHLAEENGIDMPKDELELLAERFALDAVAEVHVLHGSLSMDCYRNEAFLTER